MLLLLFFLKDTGRETFAKIKKKGTNLFPPFKKKPEKKRSGKLREGGGNERETRELRSISSDLRKAAEPKKM